MTDRDRSGVRQMFLLPHTVRSLEIIEILRQHLNTDRYKMRVRGRTPNREITDKTFNYSVPIALASNLGVYVDVKPELDESHPSYAYKERQDLKNEIASLRYSMELKDAQIADLTDAKALWEIEKGTYQFDLDRAKDENTNLRAEVSRLNEEFIKDGEAIRYLNKELKKAEESMSVNAEGRDIHITIKV